MEIVSGLQTYQLIIFIILGLVVLFAGYRIKKVAFFVIWFLLGFNLMTMLMPTLNKMVPQIAENALWQNLLPVGGGLLLALLGFSIEKLCLSGICFALVMLATVQYFGTEIQTLAIGGIVGVIAAGSSAMLMKPATIIATSAVGAYVLTLAILTLFTQINQEVYYWPILLGLTLIGALCQFATTKRIE